MEIFTVRMFSTIYCIVTVYCSDFVIDYSNSEEEVGEGRVCLSVFCPGNMTLQQDRTKEQY